VSEDTATTINRKSRSRQIILGLLLAACCFFLVTFLAYLLGANADTITTASNTIDSWRYLLMAVRVAIIFIAWTYWNAINEQLYPSTLAHHINKRDVFLTLRHKFLMGFLAIELLLAQNLLGYLLGMIV
jgi:hypothetical protein